MNTDSGGGGVCVFFNYCLLHYRGNTTKPYDTFIVVITYTLFKINYTNYYIILGEPND